MSNNILDNSRFKGLKIAITGANGSLGRFLIEEFKKNGAYIVGLTHAKQNDNNSYAASADEWIYWSCGQEEHISERLDDVDLLILNHGFNPKKDINNNSINKGLEINSLSHWRFIQIFEKIALNKNKLSNAKPKEIWINTSEAEIQIAFSPVYEITKRITGEIISLKKAEMLIEKKNTLIIKKLILGPFKSNLNPQGILSPEFVAKKIIKEAEKEDYLIIVTPNPITYMLMPIVEGIRLIYCRLINKIFTK